LTLGCFGITYQIIMLTKLFTHKHSLWFWCPNLWPCHL